MKVGLYAVYDVATERYLHPVCAETDAAAERQFANTVNSRPDHPFNVNAVDHSLHKIGTFDDGTGMVVHETPRLLMTAVHALERMGSQLSLLDEEAASA